MATIIPPGGFMGFAQQTAATQQLLRGKKRKKRKKSSRALTVGARTRSVSSIARSSARKKATKKRAPRKSGSTKRLIKGSPAAKKRMKQLRAMQGKK